MQSQLHVLTIEIAIGDLKEVIYPVILKDDIHCVLIDAGYPNHLDQLEAAIRQVGIAPEALTHLVITHHDHDHMGAAAEIKRKYPKVIVMASQAESPYISGEKKALRLEQAEVLQKVLPPEKQAFGQAFAAYLKTIEPVNVDQTLSGQVLLPLCGGCWVIETPGHTAGHIALYIPEHRTVITGDAMVLENGELIVANPEYALDLALAEQSFEKLLALKAAKYVCYHGGVYENQQLADEGPFYHGTKADLKVGDTLEPLFHSNYGSRQQANFVYMSATLDAAIWGAELALGDAPERIYVVEPTGSFEDDPNLTDKKFPGNPTRSYRTTAPLRIIGEVKEWQGHAPEVLQQMKAYIAQLKAQGVEAINK